MRTENDLRSFSWPGVAILSRANRTCSGRPAPNLSGASHSRRRHRRNSHQPWFWRGRPPGSVAAERARLYRTCICVRHAGRDRRSAQHTTIDKRDRPSARRCQSAWARASFLPRCPRSSVELATGDRRGTPSDSELLKSKGLLRPRGRFGAYLHERHDRPAKRRHGDACEHRC